MTQTAVRTDPTSVGGVNARRARGAVLLLGAVLIVALVEGGVLARYWFPALTGVTYLAAAAAGRSRGTLWAPGLIVTTVGIAVALWLRDGRSVDSFELVALSAMALGLGGVLAAALGRVADITISAMSVAVSTLLFGAFVLLEQQGVPPFAGQVWPYAALLGLWGVVELARPRVRS